MDPRTSLLGMLKALHDDTVVLHQQGAGYYSCVPIVQRYNKLLAQAKYYFPSADGLFSTFDSLEERDPKDPSDKMIVMQGIRVEIGQLMSLLDTLEEGEK